MVDPGVRGTYGPTGPQGDQGPTIPFSEKQTTRIENLLLALSNSLERAVEMDKIGETVIVKRLEALEKHITSLEATQVKNLELVSEAQAARKNSSDIKKVVAASLQVNATVRQLQKEEAQILNRSELLKREIIELNARDAMGVDRNIRAGAFPPAAGAGSPSPCSKTGAGPANANPFFTGFPQAPAPGQQVGSAFSLYPAPRRRTAGGAARHRHWCSPGCSRWRRSRVVRRRCSSTTSSRLPPRRRLATASSRPSTRCTASSRPSLLRLSQSRPRSRTPGARRAALRQRGSRACSRRRSWPTSCTWAASEGSARGPIPARRATRRVQNWNRPRERGRPPPANRGGEERRG